MNTSALVSQFQQQATQQVSSQSSEAADKLREEKILSNVSQNKKSLGQDDFLSLLTIQMTNQNPLEPMQDTEFIAQMANFSSLEQMKELTGRFDEFTSDSLTVTAQNYLGKDVDVQNEDGALESGIVEEVTSNDDGVFVRVGETQYNVRDIRGVRMAGNSQLTQP